MSASYTVPNPLPRLVEKVLGKPVTESVTLTEAQGERLQKLLTSEQQELNVLLQQQAAAYAAGDEAVKPAEVGGYSEAEISFLAIPGEDMSVCLFEYVYQYTHIASGIIVYVSMDHRYQESVLAQADTNIGQYPFAIETLGGIHFSHRTDLPGVASTNTMNGVIHYPRPQGRVNLHISRSPRVFNHEVGHLIGKDGGPPDRKEWKKAIQADTDLISELRPDQRRGLRKVRDFDGFPAQLVINRRWITPYARHQTYQMKTDDEGNRIRGSVTEDWAESWSFYLFDRKHGYFIDAENWEGDGETIRLTFEEVFPHRALLLKNHYEQQASASVIAAANGFLAELG